MAIIGIVAAMTIPTLVQNYQDKVTIIKLIKTKATVEQMLRNMIVADGVEQLSKTSVWALNGGNDCYPSDITSKPACKDFYNAFKNYAKVEIDLNIRKYSYLCNPNSPTYDLAGSLILPDGVMLSSLTFYPTSSPRTAAECDKIKKRGGSMCSRIGEVHIDVNGANGPNVYGRDIFYYSISDEGRLYAVGGKDYALFFNQTPLEANSLYWRNSSLACGTPGKKDTVEKHAWGWGCAARIEENDWKIDY